MTSLQAPLTIIPHGSGSGGGGNAPPLPPAATWFDDDSRHFVALEARPFSFDRHRGGGLGAFNDGGAESALSRDSSSHLRGSASSGVESIDDSSVHHRRVGQTSEAGPNSDDEASEIVHYRAFGIHHDHRENRRPSLEKDGGAGPDNDEEDSGSVHYASKPQGMSAFDAAKRAARSNLNALTAEISVAFPLPAQLASVETARMDASVESHDDETCATEPTVMISRRIPILAKFSPKMRNGMRFLALQYTPTMVRICTVEGESSGAQAVRRKSSLGRRASFSGFGASDTTRAKGDENDMNHWTIDLSLGTCPAVSKPDQLPTIDERLAGNIFNKSSKVEEGIVQGTTSIIGGGVLWCARGGGKGGPLQQKQQQQHDYKANNSSLDLIIVTTTSVLVYSMNIIRKQLVRAQVLPHDLAASFWYEPMTCTLVIGSYKDNYLSQVSNAGSNGELWQDRHPKLPDPLSRDEQELHDPPTDSNKGSLFPSAVMSMKTLFLSMGSPSVESFPTFAVGTLREISDKSDDERHELMLSLETFDPKLEREEAKDPDQSAVVLPGEIFLLNLYGSAYCVELGSLGFGRGIGLTKIDRKAGCIHVRQQNFDAFKQQAVDLDSAISVGVIDNLLCIFSKQDGPAHLLDVADLFSDDQRVHRESIEHFNPDMHDENLSFLAPSYFLDTSGQGLLFEIGLSLPLFSQSAPPTACIIPSLLRRNSPEGLIRSQIMGRFSTLIGTRDMSSLRKWMGVIVDQYAKSEDAIKYDSESTVTLLSKSSLVSLDGIVDPDDDGAYLDHIMVPASCRQVLCQTEVLQLILLPHAMSAIKKGDPMKLKFISSLSVHYFIELERKIITSCVALHCLVVALLWRTGQNAELKSFLLAQQSNWSVTRQRRQMGLTINRMYFEYPGATAFGETLFLIATDEPTDKVPCTPSTTRQLISYATIILVGCGATSLATRCLLSAGHLHDAINVSLKVIKANKGVENSKFAEGTQSKDFLRAAISHARKLSEVSERCQSFYHLHCFLQQWDPSAFTLDSRKIRVSRIGGDSDEQRQRKSLLSAREDLDTVVVEQSILAHDCPRFPDELFGGREMSCCRKLRAMFGYPTLS